MFASLRIRKFSATTLTAILLISCLPLTRVNGHGIERAKRQPPITIAKSTPAAHAETAIANDEATATNAGADARREALEDFDKLPLVFEENEGQTNDKVRFMARGQGYSLFLTPAEAVLSLHQLRTKKRATKRSRRAEYSDTQHHQSLYARPSASGVVRVELVAANRAPEMRGEAEQEIKTNYFIGNDAAKWRTARRFGRVRYEQVYAGVDMIYYGRQQELEYDFEVAPYADARRIRLRYTGAERVSINKAGELVLRMRDGREVRQRRPVAYQEINGERREVSSRYVKIGKRIAGLKLGEYNRAWKLVIDPVLSYATYLGGSGDDFNFGPGIAVDQAGNAYITGRTDSINFPVRNQYQPRQTGIDVFVAKLNTNAAGDASLVYSTYLGGTGDELGIGIAVDASGNAYVTGVTGSSNFPVRNQYQTALSSDNGFVTKLNTNVSGDASLVYSTYLGGDGSDGGYSIAIDGSGHAYVTGNTGSPNFPLRHQYQADQPGNDSFVTELDTNASGDASLIYSTYLGGNGFADASNGIAVDASGYTYVTGNTVSTNFPTRGAFQAAHFANDSSGYDAYVTKLNTHLAGDASLIYSTYLGGNNYDLSFGVAADASGNVYVTGETTSSNYPVRNQYQASGSFSGAFVTRINTNTTGDASLVYSTYLNGSVGARGYGIAVNATGQAYVVGTTGSSDFPVRNPYQTDRSIEDAFLTKLDTNASGNASLIYSTYLGGNGFDYGYGIALDNSGDVYVTGRTDSVNMLVRNQYQTVRGGVDVYVMRLREGTPLKTGEFDGDRKTDVSIWRPADGNWHIRNSTNGATTIRQWGLSTDVITPGDYDGDAKTDLAVFRPSEGNWYIIQSATGTGRVQGWGAANDIPVPADYDGDQKTDIAVYRPSEGNWYIILSTTNTVRLQNWGIGEDKPVRGDYDGDGNADLAVYRPSEGNWYILQSATNTVLLRNWGTSTDQPVPADYTGDARTDIAVYRPSEGNWYIIIQIESGSARIQQWGLSSDVPVPGDYDDDGRADIAVWRPSESNWYIIQSRTNTGRVEQLGQPGDLPVPSSYLPR